ncbi:MAG: hypothetical protein Q4E35_02770 [Eubacteriales bacterium]|nr:hypothetical protein [Eubacteriales bacterium]
MVYPVYKYTTADKIIAVVLAGVILLLCLASLNYSCIWGDDSAAYISEGIAIAEGNFKEHVKLNPMLHPSYLGDNVKDELVYVWGYPLLLSVLYRAVGFDTDNYSSIIIYKLPSAVFLAVMTLCFFLLLRRRFSLGVSVFVTCFFCSAPLFTETVNSLYSDIVYMGMCMLTLLVTELYLEEQSRRRQIIKGVILGVLMWYSMEVRTNGTVFVAVLAAAQIAELIRERNFNKDKLLTLLLPYAVFLVLKAVTEYVIFRPVTANSADFSVAAFDFIVHNTLYYIINLYDFIFHLFYNLLSSLLMWVFPVEKLVSTAAVVSALCKAAAGLTFAMMILGIFTDGLRKNQYLTLYVVGCAVGTCILPYNQGLRYMLGIMPVMAIFAICGYHWVISKLFKKRGKHSALSKAVTAAAVIILCAASCSVQYRTDLENIRRIKANGDDIHAGMEEMYSPDAVAVYGYIKENTPEDAVVTFHKPRALYLNTGRLGFSYLVNGHDPLDADYCILPELFYDTYINEEAPEWFSEFEVVFRTPELTVMKKITSGIS